MPTSKNGPRLDNIRTTREFRPADFLERVLADETKLGGSRTYYGKSHDQLRRRLAALALAVLCIGLGVAGVLLAISAEQSADNWLGVILR